jgi:hypothetical protein
MDNAMTVSVKIDRAKFEGLKSAMSGDNLMSVDVGVFDQGGDLYRNSDRVPGWARVDLGEYGHFSHAELAANHEFGFIGEDWKTGTMFPVPARPFLRTIGYVPGIMGKMKDAALEFFQNFANGVTAKAVQLLETTMLRLAHDAVMDIFDSKGLGRWSPLAEITKIRRHRHGNYHDDAILIDRGVLISSIASRRSK